MTPILLVILIIHGLFAVMEIFLIVSFFTGAPFVPTPGKRISQMMKLAGITNDDTVIDIGSGDGRILAAAAQRGAKVIGWEINPILVLFTWLRIKISGISRLASVHWGDYRKADLSYGTVVFVYGIQKHMATIESVLTSQLSKGTKIVCYTFPLPNRKYEKHIPEAKLFLYQV